GKSAIKGKCIQTTKVAACDTGDVHVDFAYDEESMRSRGRSVVSTSTEISRKIKNSGTDAMPELILQTAQCQTSSVPLDASEKIKLPQELSITESISTDTHSALVQAILPLPRGPELVSTAVMPSVDIIESVVKRWLMRRDRVSFELTDYAALLRKHEQEDMQTYQVPVLSDVVESRRLRESELLCTEPGVDGEKSVGSVMHIEIGRKTKESGVGTLRERRARFFELETQVSPILAVGECQTSESGVDTIGRNVKETAMETQNRKATIETGTQARSSDVEVGNLVAVDDAETIIEDTSAASVNMALPLTDSEQVLLRGNQGLQSSTSTGVRLHSTAISSAHAINPTEEAISNAPKRAHEFYPTERLSSESFVTHSTTFDVSKPQETCTSDSTQTRMIKERATSPVGKSKGVSVSISTDFAEEQVCSEEIQKADESLTKASRSKICCLVSTATMCALRLETDRMLNENVIALDPISEVSIAAIAKYEESFPLSANVDKSVIKGKCIQTTKVAACDTGDVSTEFF
ncbi:unnamed protein product, partial [Hymenolepis diminuta]|uniref:BRCT domain-containing protein n=1 Tax=Hymenolepis diminuta TaxID=6216 RepID=A0A0R3SNL4_HYMDI